MADKSDQKKSLKKDKTSSDNVTHEKPKETKTNDEHRFQ